MGEAGQTEIPASVPRPAPLRRNTGFRMLWIGQLAYPLLILALTHSAVLAGIVGTARMIALVCLQLPAGALSDRLDRRLTMIVCDSLRAVLLAVLGVLIVLHLASWPIVLVAGVIDGGANAIFNPAVTAALSGIVPDGQLEQAWAATEGRAYAASLAGPALGGVLFGLGRAVPFLADAVSYVVSFGTVSRIRGRFLAEKAVERKALWREVADGLQLVWRVPILRAAVIVAPLINFAFNGVIFTITLALRQHGTSTAVIGLVQAAVMAGGLLGAMVAPRLQGAHAPGNSGHRDDSDRGAAVRRCRFAYPVTSGGGTGRHVGDARTGRERGAVCRDAAQRAGGDAGPGHQHGGHGGHVAGDAGAADCWRARRARVWRLGDGCLRRRYRRGGRAVPDPAGLAAGGVPGSRTGLNDAPVSPCRPRIR